MPKGTEALYFKAFRDDEFLSHPKNYTEYAGRREEKAQEFPGTKTREVLKMGMTWKEIIAELTKDFVSWGCPYRRKKIPEIAMGYDCTPLFFWNWMDDPETPRSEKGFLRVLGYAWRKYLQEEADSEPRLPERAAVITEKTETGRRKAA